MQEKDIEKKFREAVKAEGGIAFKFTSPGNAGVPDRLVILPQSRIGFVELKAPGKKPTKLQERMIGQLQELGCFVCVLDAPEKIQEVIRGIKLCKSYGDTQTVMKFLKESGEYGI